MSVDPSNARVVHVPWFPVEQPMLPPATVPWPDPVTLTEMVWTRRSSTPTFRAWFSVVEHVRAPAAHEVPVPVHAKTSHPVSGSAVSCTVVLTG